MPLIAWPQVARITDYSHELWSPGRIVHRARDGSLSALDRARERWRGTAEVGVRGLRGESGQTAAARLELFLAELTDLRNYVDMPWGGERPAYPVPGPSASSWSASVTAASAGVFTLNIPPTELAVGQWLRHNNRVNMIATVAGGPMAQISFVSDAFDGLTVGGSLLRALTIRIRRMSPTDAGLPVSRGRGFGGGTVIQWEEYVP